MQIIHFFLELIFFFSWEWEKNNEIGHFQVKESPRSPRGLPAGSSLALEVLGPQPWVAGEVAGDDDDGKVGIG